MKPDVLPLLQRIVRSVFNHNNTRAYIVECTSVLPFMIQFCYGLLVPRKYRALNMRGITQFGELLVPLIEYRLRLNFDV